MADKIGVDNRITPIPKTPSIVKSKISSSGKHNKKSPEPAKDRSENDVKVGKHIDERC